jgi:hypothetical protein
MNTKLINNIEQFVLEIPKVELHLHIEGAIPLETLFDFIQKRGGEPSIKNLDDLRRKLNYTNFAHFIDLWVWKNTFIKEEKDFEEIAYQVLCNLSKQNVKYVEAHYAPGDYWRQGLSEQGITECLIKGKQRARDDFETCLHRIWVKGLLVLDLVGVSRPFLLTHMLIFIKKQRSEVSDLLLMQVKQQDPNLYGLLLKNLGLNGLDME